MALFQFELRGTPTDVAVFTIARTITGQSIMELRQRIATGEPLLSFDFDDFPISTERSEHYEQIRTSIEKLTSCNCDHFLLYKYDASDLSEIVTYEQACNLLKSDMQYREQDRD
jgi:hypothetical protein